MADLMAKVFKGTNVFMSRNLVPPELFDSLHDALKLNGAQVFLCCDPSRNAPNDYHVISSPVHEKFEDLRIKGCNLLGPQCVLSCAKEHRPLPKQGFTCCLAMDGVKLIVSGFEMDEKVEIGKMVSSMGGVLQQKATMDVNFVVVKNILAAKYKWAMNALKKPIVTISWLHQCWKEHRVVPHESYRVLPFSGLTICVSKFPADERKQMEKLTMQNGGKYSAELTRKCTHLICEAPEGDKYKVAVRWGHIHIVTRKWFEQSADRRACLNEESYPVQLSSASLNTVKKGTVHGQDKSVGSSQNVVSSAGGGGSEPQAWYAQSREPDAYTFISHGTSLCDAPVNAKEEFGPPASDQKCPSDLDSCVADDSQEEDNDLYLSDCKILLAGFAASDMRNLVNMVRRGGGSRYMSFSEKLTHIIVGAPSDIETRQIRNLAALGVIFVVKTQWLEDCNHDKKEVPVLRRHIAYDLLLPKDPVYSAKRPVTSFNETKQGKCSVPFNVPDDGLELKRDYTESVLLQKRKDMEVISTREPSLEKTRTAVEEQACDALEEKCETKTQKDASFTVKNTMSSNVFKGKLFCFSDSFPDNQRGEIIEWVNQGGGKFVENIVNARFHFTVECHGVVIPWTDSTLRKYVSSHWIRCCLMEGCLLDVDSHILYSPLQCQVPFNGFENLRFCVSQYDEKERLLLKNLCFILKVKFTEKLTKRVTHLVCKYAIGPKYEAAPKWGIKPVTAKWIYECIKQDKVVASGAFCPKEATSQDRETGSCLLTQHPTQAVRMISIDGVSQFSSQSQDIKESEAQNISRNVIGMDNSLNECNKKARIMEANQETNVSFVSNPIESNITEKTSDMPSALPDVAAAIEDLLEQTSKIHEQKSPERSRCGKVLFASDCTILDQDHGEPQSALLLPNHWINSRMDKKDEVQTPTGDVKYTYDSFSETQTESQVIGYAEDLSGRQMIIDRVRTRSSVS